MTLRASTLASFAAELVDQGAAEGPQGQPEPEWDVPPGIGDGAGPGPAG